MRARPTDFAEYRRLRRRARLLTLAVLVPGLPCLLGAVLAATKDGEARRAGMVFYLVCVSLLVVSWGIVRPAWRRSYRARPVVQSLDPTPGEVYGITELDAEPPAHRGLSGEIEPPRRW